MSARQIAALLGSNPDNSSNNNNNQNLNRQQQQQQQQQQQPLSNSVVGTSVNVNVNVHPYTSAVVSLPLRYGNQQYQYPYQQYPSQNQHYQYQQQYQHPPLVSEQHQQQQAHPSMVGSNNSFTNANSIPPAMVPQVASQVEVEEAIDNYILPQSNPGYYAGMSTHQVAASLGLPAHRCNIPYQDEIIEMPPTTQVSPNKQPHPQPLQPDLVSSTSNDDKVVSTESKADSPQRDVPLTKLDEAIGFLRTLNLKEEQHERNLLERTRTKTKMADKEEGNKKYILNNAMPASREEEEKDATANQDLSVRSIKAAVSQGQRESSECELSALFQSQINLQREIPAGLFAKPTIKNEVRYFCLWPSFLSSLF